MHRLASLLILLLAGALAPVRGEVVEDIALARHLAAQGQRVGFLDASELLTVRMFESFADVLVGWGRSLALPGVEPPRRQLVDLAVVVVDALDRHRIQLAVAHLGAVLGEVIRAQSGDERFAQEERIRELATARAAGQPVMLDFYADWCTYCKQMERQTFSDPTVAGLMSEMVLLQADVTRQDDADKALQDHVGIPAPPAMIFWGADGVERRHLRLLGFMGPEEFAPHVREALQ